MLYVPVMFCRVIIIVPEFHLSNSMTKGIIWGMTCSLTYAALSLTNRKYVKKYSGRLIAFYEQGTATLVLLPALFLYKPRSPSPTSLFSSCWGAFTAGAHSMFINGMKHVQAQTAGMVSSLESVYGIAAAAIFLGEIPSFNELAEGS